MWFDEMHLYTVDPVYNTNKYLYPPTLFYSKSFITTNNPKVVFFQSITVLQALQRFQSTVLIL